MNLFHLTAYYMNGSWGRNLEAETKAKAMENHSSVACSHGLLPYTANRPPTVGWALPHPPVINEEKAPTDLPKGQSDADKFLS